MVMPEHTAKAFDVDLQVTVQVGDVEQGLQEVCGDLTLSLELCHPGGRSTGRCSRCLVVLVVALAGTSSCSEMASCAPPSASGVASSLVTRSA